jgi:hypothetical protein
MSTQMGGNGQPVRAGPDDCDGRYCFHFKAPLCDEQLSGRRPPPELAFR